MPRFRTTLIGVLASAVVVSGLVGATDTGEKEKVQIALTNEAMRVGSTIVCSLKELEESLAIYSKTTYVQIDNDPDIPTEKFIRLMQILRSLGFDEITSNGPGDPGWTLYPLPKDIDIFNCNVSRQDGGEEAANDS